MVNKIDCEVLLFGSTKLAASGSTCCNFTFKISVGEFNKSDNFFQPQFSSCF